MGIHAEDCFDWMEKNYTDRDITILGLWKDKTKDIEAPVNKEAFLYMCNLCGIGEK